MSYDAAPTSTISFDELGLPAQLVKALSRANITIPTPVQAAVLPDAMAGHDVLGRARTGSGKTLAFGLPIVARLAGGRSKPKAPRALIIVPTRELAAQVRAHIEPMADAMHLRVGTVYGGTPYDRQIKRLRAGVDIIVATPGRLDDLINRGACRLDQVEITVLDEADHLCDLGFFPAVSELVSMTPDGGQRMLLSATLDGDVDKLVRKHLSNPITHDCDPDAAATSDMEHHVLVTGRDNKLETTAALLRANPRSIVFTRTRHGATNLAEDLADLGVTTVDLHGMLSQNARERNLRKFRNGQADVVVATDVAARGIHVDGVGLVVHYDAPIEPKAYLHRSGRTARAGNSGAVITITTNSQLRTVMRLQRTAGVTARHHDARTAPHPMTAEALSTSGVASEDVAVESGAQSGSGRSHSSKYAGSRGSRQQGVSGYRGHTSGDRRSSDRPGRPARDDRGGSYDRAPRRNDDRPRSFDRSDRPAGGNRGGSYDRAPRRADDRPRSFERPERRTAERSNERAADHGTRAPQSGPNRPSSGKPAGGKKTKSRWTAAERKAQR